MEKEYLTKMVSEGHSIRGISNDSGKSYTTVRYWLHRHSLKTKNQLNPSRRGSEDRYVDRECKKHGVTEHIWEQPVKEKYGRYRCKKCRSFKVSEDRRKLRKEAVETAGGRCSTCGYSKSLWALQFHHIHKDEKSYNIGDLVRDRKKKLLFEELEKCVLLCANCHAEAEEKEHQDNI